MAAGFWLGLAAALAAAALYGVGAVLQAHAVRRLGDTDGLVSFVSRAARSPLVVGVVGIYLAGFALHAVAIWQLPLYLAQAGIAASLPLTALCAPWLGERVTGRQWVAVLLVVVGLVLLSLGAGAAGEPVATPLFAAACLAAVAVIGGLSRLTDHGAVLGALAGLAYAGCAVSVRGISAEPTWSGAACALAVAAHGVLGFWLYSRALARSEVSVATAPLVAGEVLGPTLVGLALLGDQVRDGWWPAIVLGVALATAGSMLVSSH